MPAMCMQCQHGKVTRKCKLDTVIKYPCSVCKLAKIEDAFPRAQLKQEDGKKCLACCKKADNLRWKGFRLGRTRYNFFPV